MADLLSLQDSHLPPLLTQLCHALSHPLRRHQILHLQQIEFLAERQEVREQRVEVRLDTQMHDLFKVRVVDVSEDAEEVLEDVFGGVCERVGKLPA